jgi:hypothetical protein
MLLIWAISTNMPAILREKNFDLAFNYFLFSAKPLGDQRICKPKESSFLWTEFIVTYHIGQISSIFFWNIYGYLGA